MSTNQQRTIAVLLAALMLGSLSGCAGKLTRKLAFLKKKEETPVSTAARPPTVEPTSHTASPPISYGTVPAGLQQSPVTSDSGGTVTNAIRRASNAVSNALTIEPKVVRPEDPVSLSSSPANVGSDLYLHAARVNENRGNLRLAHQQYQKAMDVDPNNPKVLVSYARLFDREGRLSEAEKLYRKAAKADPGNAMVMNDLALCYARQGNLPRAAETLERAVQLEPHNVRYRNNIATVLTEIGRTDDALKHLTAAHPPAIAHYNLGQLLARRDRGQESIVWFQRALQIDPTLVPAQQMMHKLAGGSNGTLGVASGALSSGPTTVTPRPPYAGR